MILVLYATIQTKSACEGKEVKTALKCQDASCDSAVFTVTGDGFSTLEAHVVKIKRVRPSAPTTCYLADYSKKGDWEVVAVSESMASHWAFLAKEDKIYGVFTEDSGKTFCHVKEVGGQPDHDEASRMGPYEMQYGPPYSPPKKHAYKIGRAQIGGAKNVEFLVMVDRKLQSRLGNRTKVEREIFYLQLSSASAVAMTNS